MTRIWLLVVIPMLVGCSHTGGSSTALNGANPTDVATRIGVVANESLQEPPAASIDRDWKELVSLGDSAIPGIEIALTDNDEETRWWAVDLANCINTKESIGVIEKYALSSPQQGVSYGHAIESLAHHSDQADKAVFEKALSSHNGIALLFALQALRETGDADMGPSVVHLLAELKRPDVIAEAGRYIKAFPSAKYVKPLQEAKSRLQKYSTVDPGMSSQIPKATQSLDEAIAACRAAN